MAISTTTTILYDGPRRTVVQGNGIGVAGQTASNLTLAVFVDVTTLNPIPKSLRVDEIEADVSYGVAQLFWAAPTPVVFATLSGSNIDFDYDNFGGIRPPPGATGNILISTQGFDVNSTYMIKLFLQKRLIK